MTRDTIIIKVGVEWYAMHPRMIEAYRAWQDLLAPYGVPAVVTSARDGRHITGSRHYTGRAIDLRTRDIPPHLLQDIADRYRDRMGSDWVVILERDHLHVHIT